MTRVVSRRLTARDIRNAVTLGILAPFAVAALGSGLIRVAFALCDWCAR